MQQSQKIEIYKEWLYAMKLTLGVPDNSRDALLMTYLRNSHITIWTQYYNFDLVPVLNDNAETIDDIDWNHKWAYDETTMLAVIHLANSLATNPDTTLQASNIVDKRQIYRILAGRVNYY